MRTTLNTLFVALFAISMTIFLLLAFALVIVQFAGLVAAQPGWIDGAAELKQPSIITAVCAGLFGFGAFNTTRRVTPESQEAGA